MNTSKMLGLLFCPIIGLHAASSDNSLPNNICQLYDPENPTKKTGIITYNESTPSGYKGKKFFGFNGKLLIQLEENSIRFGSMFNTLVYISYISELVSGGKAVNPNASGSCWKYYPAIRFILFKNNEKKVSPSKFISHQEKKIQTFDGIEQVRDYLIHQKAPNPTLIFDLVAWLRRKHGQNWQEQLPIKCIRCPNETFSGYKHATQLELQAKEPKDTKCLIQ